MGFNGNQNLLKTNKWVMSRKLLKPICSAKYYVWNTQKKSISLTNQEHTHKKTEIKSNESDFEIIIYIYIFMCHCKLKFSFIMFVWIIKLKTDLVYNFSWVEWQKNEYEPVRKRKNRLL